MGHFRFEQLDRRAAYLVAFLALVAALSPHTGVAAPKPPTVTITSPADGASFIAPTSVNIGASAQAGQGSLRKVEFFQGATKLGEDLTAPYSFRWNSPPVGDHTLTAKATNSWGAKSTSAPVRITVNDPRAATGEWSPVYPWPDFGIHLHVLPTGRVLTYSHNPNDGNAAGSTPAYVVDVPTNSPPVPPAQAIAVPNLRTNLFCSGHSFLPDGRLLIMGGHLGVDGRGDDDANTLEFNGSQYIWHPQANMAAGRWYPSAVTLPNGDVLVAAGSIEPEPNLQMNTIPEVWQTNLAGWRELTNASMWMQMYPFLHVEPTNGHVFVAGPNTDARFLDTAGLGSWQSEVYFHVYNGLRDYGSSVMYAEGQVFVVGGGESPPTATAEVIDLKSQAPAWRSVQPMLYARRHLNATLLPDGTVLVTGGTSSPGANDGTFAVFAAESWDPATELWTTLASARNKRLYHSTAVLLPDGRVLSVGGGWPDPSAGSDGQHKDAEIFSPPYLFKGPRPSILAAPASVRYGQMFFVQTPDAASITQAVWVRLSTVTHAFNMGQRMNRLAFTPASGGLSVTAPSTGKAAPPGHYMLFLLNSKGVPSVAKIIQITE